MITTTWDSFQSVLNEFSNAHFLMCFFYITLGLALHSIHLPVRKFYTFLCSSFYTIHYLFLHSFIVCAVFFHQFGTQTYSDSWRMSLGPFQTNQFFPIPPCFSASGFNFFFFFSGFNSMAFKTHVLKNRVVSDSDIPTFTQSVNL